LPRRRATLPKSISCRSTFIPARRSCSAPVLVRLPSSLTSTRRPDRMPVDPMVPMVLADRQLTLRFSSEKPPFRSDLLDARRSYGRFLPQVNTCYHVCAAAVAPSCGANAVPAGDFDTWIARVRGAGSALDDAGYAQLAKPSKAVPPMTFRSVAPNLFERIIDQTVSGSQKAGAGVAWCPPVQPAGGRHAREPHLGGDSLGRSPRSSHPAVSAFPGRVAGSACTSSFSRSHDVLWVAIDFASK
jgi:hypothetical protein